MKSTIFILTLTLGLLWPVYGQTFPALPDAEKIASLRNDLPHTLANCDHSPANAAALIAALTAATSGQTICLLAGSTYTGNFILNKNNAQYITIRSTAAGDLPAGVRVGPGDIAKLAKIVTNTGTGGFQVRPGAARYRLIGLEFTSTGANSVLLKLGTNNTNPAGGAVQSQISHIPQRVIIDRCYLHARTPATSTGIGIEIEADYTAIVDSYIGPIQNGSGDEQAILGVNCQGPILIENNFLHGAGENIMFGGSDPGIQQIIPSDIILRGNYIWKDPARRNGDSLYKIKNLFELKNGRRILLEGNVFENFWSGVQAQYYAIVLKTANQGNICSYDNGSYNQTSNITFRYNKLINVAQFITIGRLATCDKIYNGSTTFYLHDNLITGLGSNHTQDGIPKILFPSYPQLEEDGRMIYTRHITFAHNTVARPTGFGTGSVRYIHFGGQGTYVEDFYFHSNLVPGKFFVAGTNNNTAAITSRFLAPFFFKNNLAISGTPGDVGALPTQNSVKNSYSGLFVNEAGGDYQLTPDMAKLYPGADGRPVGADIQALNACLAGATTSWTGTCGEITTPPPPQIVPTIIGTLGANGWYISNVTVTWSVTDPESGISSSTGCGDTNLTSNTAGTTLTCSATNGAGRSNSVSVTIKIDKTSPAITGLPGAGCSLWPPNHKLVQVGVVSASAGFSGLTSFNVTGQSNEPENDTADIIIAGAGLNPRTVQLRAESGRIYTIQATAVSGAGTTSTATAVCTVGI